MYSSLNKKLLLVALFISTIACQSNIHQAINAYNSVAPTIKLGTNKQTVLTLLEPTQAQLNKSDQRPPEHYIKDNHRYDIYFYRHHLYQDGLNTDDEFTPYLFKNDILIGQGWSSLGGIKTSAQNNSSAITVDAPIIISW